MTGIYADHVFRFNTQPPEGGCRYAATGRRCHLVSTHSRPKAAARLMSNRILNCCFNTQPPEGGCAYALAAGCPRLVSTHSRPKAAVVKRTVILYNRLFQHTAARRRLRSIWNGRRRIMKCFNTQPPEGGWVVIDGRMSIYEVSTHSRPKAAAVQNQYALVELIVSTHSRPKAAVKSVRLT